ncbi:hypothetical protein M405DRAFT_881004 [Rhizopogon salebrosus TDB-379]|nr:hypothetical protein M405DRAFT_881004 [Rhizopogon salebrosus TDB-379]
MSHGLANQGAMSTLGSPIALRTSPINPRSSELHGFSTDQRSNLSSAFAPDGASRNAEQSTPTFHPLTILDRRDFSLAICIKAAQVDGRECLWYGVWMKVLQEYIFRNADGPQTTCIAIPQYSLVAGYDTGHSPETTRAGIGSATSVSSSSSSDVVMGILPVASTPPSHGPLMSPGSPLTPIPDIRTPLFLPDPTSPTTNPHELFWGSLNPLTPSSYHQVPRTLPGVASPARRVTRSQTARHSTDVANSGLVSPMPSDGIQSLAFQHSTVLPSTPPRPTTHLRATRGNIQKSSRIPDIVQVLARTHQQYPNIPDSVDKRVILVVEIKPEPKDPGGPIDWLLLWNTQVKEQAIHAFDADLSLKYLGIIMARGSRWIYRVVNRPSPDGRTMSERRDPTFPSGGPPEAWSTDSADSSPEDWPSSSDPPELMMQRPSFLQAPVHNTVGNDAQIRHDFYLLDPRGESLSIFANILRDLHSQHEDMWI